MALSILCCSLRTFPIDELQGRATTQKAVAAPIVRYRCWWRGWVPRVRACMMIGHHRATSGDHWGSEAMSSLKSHKCLTNVLKSMGYRLCFYQRTITWDYSHNDLGALQCWIQKTEFCVLHIFLTSFHQTSPVADQCSFRSFSSRSLCHGPNSTCQL